MSVKNRRKTSEPLPDARVSLDRYFSILKVLKDGKAMNKEEISNFIPEKINTQLIGAALTFYSKIGFLESEPPYKYKVEDNEVSTFIKELIWNNEKKARELLKKILSDTWFVKHLKELKNLGNDFLSKEEIIFNLGRKAEADPQYHRSALVRVFEFLEYSEFLELNDSKNKYKLNFDINFEQVDHINEKNLPFSHNIDENMHTTNDMIGDKDYEIQITGRGVDLKIQVDKTSKLKIIKDYIDLIEEELSKDE